METKEIARTIEEKKVMCRFCEKWVGTVPIVDDESSQELWICEQCDNELFDAATLQKMLAREIQMQIRHHEREGNKSAVRSLQYIMDIIFNNCKEVD